MPGRDVIRLTEPQLLPTAEGGDTMVGFAVAHLPPYVRRMPTEDLVRAFAADFLLLLENSASGHVTSGHVAGGHGGGASFSYGDLPLSTDAALGEQGGGRGVRVLFGSQQVISAEY